jgi:hypothetical protein
MKSTTAFDDQFTPATQNPVVVREAYDTVAILRRNITDMEVALRTQTERAEAAEGELEAVREDNHNMMTEINELRAELAKLAQQSPIKYLYRVIDCFGHDVLRDDPKGATILETIPLYAAPVPAPHKGATHCDDCGLTWLDDGLNPLRCPYCKDAVPAPAVPAVLNQREGNVTAAAIAFFQAERDYNYAYLRSSGSKVFELKKAVQNTRKQLEEALLQSSPQVTAVPAEIIELSKKYAIDTEAYHAAMDALLQSAEVTK